MKLSPATKVGILTLISVIILIFGIMWLKGRSISAGERIEVKFQDVDGMRPGSAVQMMGIRIGQVEDVIPVIDANNSYVKLKFVITEPDISIPQASTISIQQSGIIGEKFIEITPPRTQIIYLPVTHNIKTLVAEASPVKLLVDNEYVTVGQIQSAEIVDKRTLTQAQQEYITTKYAYKIGYMVTKPGTLVPDDSTGSLDLSDYDKGYELKLIPPANVLVQNISASGKYTIIEPMRLKEFFDIQLKSAIALKETNDRINSLLSQQSISDLKATFKNTKELTASATQTLNEATALLSSSKGEIDNLVTLATNLSNKMIVLSDNINSIVGDPKLKSNLIATTDSIQKSAKSISDMLSDPKLQDTLVMVNDSAKNLSDITRSLNTATKDQDVKNRLNSTLTNLNSSLSKLSVTLDNVNNLSDTDKKKLKSILEDSSDITANLKQFSDKLNKRFLLLRLMF